MSEPGAHNDRAAGAMRVPGDAPAWTARVENPYLRAFHAPIAHESSADDLPVVGEVPRDLYGAYVRNGPNAMLPPANLYHWFDGDGMVHGVYFRDGRVSYRSRMVRTAGLAEEVGRGEAIWPGIMGPFDLTKPRHYLKDTANTDVVYHNGAILALWYMCGEPYRLDPLTLDTVGVEDFGGRRRTSVSAHPKVDPRSGELVFFTLSDEEPYMRYGVVAANGKLDHEVPIDLPGPRAPHDITITEHYSIVHDFPFFHDVDIMRRHGYRVARFHPDIPTRFGVLPRRGGSADVRWFAFEPGYVLHMVNAWEEGDWIVMDGCFQPDPTIRRRAEEGELASMLGYLRIRAHLRRWQMNLVTGATSEEALDDLNVEFCLPDTDRYGEKTRYSYHQRLPIDPYTVEFHSLVKYDHGSGRSVRHDYGPGMLGSEAPFAARPDAAAEDDGYVVTIVTDAAELRSECWVYRAEEIERGPIARVELPARVPSGFHAKWIPGSRLWA